MAKTIITFEGSIAQIFKDATCGTTLIATSLPIDVSSHGYFGLWLKCASAGTVAVSITYEASYSQLPIDFVAPEGTTTLLAMADTNVHVLSVAPVPMKYIRFKATGTGANDASTQITGYLFAQ